MIRLSAIENSASGGVNVTPLVDVIFILLIFFLLTAQTNQGIVLDLPEAGSSESIPTETWEVTITASEQLLFNEVEIEAGTLQSVLRTARRRAPDLQLIVLRADGSATVDTFVEVMDTIRQTGFYNLVIATQPKVVVNDRSEP